MDAVSGGPVRRGHQHADRLESGYQCRARADDVGDDYFWGWVGRMDGVAVCAEAPGSGPIRKNLKQRKALGEDGATSVAPFAFGHWR